MKTSAEHGERKGKWQVHKFNLHVHVIQMPTVGKKTHSTLHMCLNIHVKRAHDAYKTPAQLLGIIIFAREKKVKVCMSKKGEECCVVVRFDR